MSARLDVGLFYFPINVRSFAYYQGITTFPASGTLIAYTIYIRYSRFGLSIDFSLKSRNVKELN